MHLWVCLCIMGWIIILCFLCGVEGGGGVDSPCVPAAYGEMIFVKYSPCGRLPEGLRLKAVFPSDWEWKLLRSGWRSEVCTVHIACEPCKYLGWWVLASSQDMVASFLGEAALYTKKHEACCRNTPHVFAACTSVWTNAPQHWFYRILYYVISLFLFLRCCRRHA